MLQEDYNSRYSPCVTGRTRFDSKQVHKLFSFSKTSRPGLRPNQQDNEIVTEVGGIGYFLGVTAPGRDADHSTPSSAHVKNEWSYTPTSPIHFHEVHRALSFT
jgi:hypothetical protein